MSEDPPVYLSREFVCEKCHRTFTPTGPELDALLAMERHFNLAPEQASLLCERCRHEVKQ